jgi:putative transposase
VLFKRVCALVFIEHGARGVHVAGISAHPDGVWTARQAGIFAMVTGERLGEMRFLVRDRGGQLIVCFDTVLRSCGLWILGSQSKAPARTRSANA